MTRFRKREKIDFRKFINRFQRVRKFCRMHTLPVLVAVGIMVSVIFASYQNAYATGLEEYFYYTYFDLMSGLFAETGVHFGLKDDYYTKSDRVSGEQVWDNFCTWVEEKAKTLALPVEVVNKTVFNELKELPNTVTSAGAKMSEKLSELLAKVLPTFNDTNGNQFDTSSANSVVKMITAVCGIQSGLYANSGVVEDVCNGYALNIVKDSGGQYSIFTNKKGYVVKDYVYSGTQKVWVNLVYVYDGKEIDSGAKNALWVSSDGKCSADGAYPYSARAPVTWIIKNGAFAGADGTTINDYANVKTLHDGSVWVPGEGFKDSWAVWDAIKDNVTTDEEEKAWNSRYNFDNDNKDDKEKKKKDNEKDKLPVAIPIIPFKKPDSTEKNTEKDTESDVPGKDPKPSKNPMINPDTGRYIDPDTGYDIDPDTGKLIDPDTGELIEPDIPSTAGKAGNWKRLFPFCIPWDMMELIKSLKADKKAPVFEFKYTFKAVNYTWVVKVDMSDYWKYIKIFRWGMTIFFIIGLFFLTVKFTTFVQRMGG